MSALLLVLALALLAGCGDDDSTEGSVSSDTDPQEVLDNALGGDQSIESGVLEVSFDLTAEGADSGTINATLSGPFQSGGEETALPEVDLTASASAEGAQTFDFEGGLVLTPDGAWVNYDGEDYQLDEATFGLLQSSYEQSAATAEESGETGSLSQFGVDPASWVTDLTNEGTEDIDGTEVVHVSGAGDVGAIVEDLTSVAEQTGQAATIDTASIAELEQLVESAEIDVYASTEDDTLRQLDLAMDITDPESDGSATLAFSIGIAEPNEEQEITPPEDAQPIADLFEQFGGLGALGALGGTTGVPGATEADPQANADFLDCVEQAQTAADLEACGTP